MVVLILKQRPICPSCCNPRSVPISSWVRSAPKARLLIMRITYTSLVSQMMYSRFSDNLCKAPVQDPLFP